MRKDLGKQLAVYPMPVLMVAAYDENGVVNVMNAAWGMIGAMDKIVLFLDEDHKTTQNIYKTKAFTVSLADREHLEAADFFGIASGNDMPDKFARSGMTAARSAHVNAPVIQEFPLAMECEFSGVMDFENVHGVVGKIVNVSADEKALDENGKVNPLKLNALMFDQFQAGYYVTGEKVGQAWESGQAMAKK